MRILGLTSRRLLSKSNDANEQSGQSDSSEDVTELQNNPTASKSQAHSATILPQLVRALKQQQVLSTTATVDPENKISAVSFPELDFRSSDIESRKNLNSFPQNLGVSVNSSISL